ILWKAFIDFEVSEGEADNARALFGRLLDRTNHVKVWISYGQFESSDAGGGLEAARKVFSDGYASLKVEGLKEERVLLLEAWKDVETAQSTAGGDPQSIAARMPRKIKMRRMAAGAEPRAGKDAVWEEYFDYHFPDDEKNI
ncbi:CRNKL1, partial [Symbiodinium microadriaticum]